MTWPNAAGLFYMSDGKNETRLEEGPVIGVVSIEREADGKELTTFVMKARGPNSYRFICYPSDVEPFDFQAKALDTKADVLEVELGSASATLHRVRDQACKQRRLRFGTSTRGQRRRLRRKGRSAGWRFGPAWGGPGRN